MANIEDLPFTDSASFQSGAVERIKNVFLSLERTRNIKLTLISYNTRATGDYWYIVFKYSYEYKNHKTDTNISDLSVEEAKELFDEEHLWPVLADLMPRGRGMQLKKRLATNDYIELCLAGGIFTIYTNIVKRG